MTSIDCPSPCMATPIDLLTILRMLPLVRGTDGAFTPMADVPDAFAERFPKLSLPQCDLEALFPFLSGFLADADEFWGRGAPGSLRSGPWTQADQNDQPTVLEATAVTAGDDRQQILLLQLPGAQFAELQEILQHARDQRLAFDDLTRMHEALADSSRRLERMAAERQTAITLLRQAREQLEDRVAERTVELRETNQRLQAESAERERANQALQSHQQQLGQLAEQLSVAEERERREIAEFLHDRVGQNLALVKLRLKALGRQVPAASPELTEVDGLMDEVISDARALTADLGTPLLYEFGLAEALRSLARRFEEVHGIEARFEHEEREAHVSDQAGAIVYQAVRELLHNIVKHAEARLVVVRMQRDGKTLRVRVLDHGVGFDASTFEFRVTTNGGFGLFNIRERLLRLGGDCAVRSTPGEGTEVELTVPLSSDAQTI